jgi:hypothetical protein
MMGGEIRRHPQDTTQHAVSFGTGEQYLPPLAFGTSDFHMCVVKVSAHRQEAQHGRQIRTRFTGRTADSAG